jgi:hypothetical protein
MPEAGRHGSVVGMRRESLWLLVGATIVKMKILFKAKRHRAAKKTG